MEHSDDGNMPETFDEVIKLGFPHENLAALAKAHKERKRNRPKPEFAPLSLATSHAAAAAAVTRKDQATMPQTERDAFKNAVVQLVNEGKYADLIRFHMDMSHNMHGTMGAVGLYRFLAWHRRYLVAFERELQRADAILRPTATQKLGVPYWRWQNAFPSWLNGFLPSKVPNTGQTPPARKNAAPPAKANLLILVSLSINSRSKTQQGCQRTTYILNSLMESKAGESGPTDRVCPPIITDILG